MEAGGGRRLGCSRQPRGRRRGGHPHRLFCCLHSAGLFVPLAPLRHSSLPRPLPLPFSPPPPPLASRSQAPLLPPRPTPAAGVYAPLSHSPPLIAPQFPILPFCRGSPSPAHPPASPSGSCPRPPSLLRSPHPPLRPPLLLLARSAFRCVCPSLSPLPSPSHAFLRSPFCTRHPSQMCPREGRCCCCRCRCWCVCVWSPLDFSHCERQVVEMEW
jgi:hypothetical protein